MLVPKLGDREGSLTHVKDEDGQVALPVGDLGLTYVKIPEVIPQLEE